MLLIESSARLWSSTHKESRGSNVISEVESALQVRVLLAHLALLDGSQEAMSERPHFGDPMTEILYAQLPQALKDADIFKAGLVRPCWEAANFS